MERRMSKNNGEQMKHTDNQLPVQSEPLLVSEEELDTATGGITLAGAAKIRKLTGTVATTPRPTIVWGGGKTGTKGGSLH
jgi:hypothetical protein